VKYGQTVLRRCATLLHSAKLLTAAARLAAGAVTAGSLDHGGGDQPVDQLGVHSSFRFRRTLNPDLSGTARGFGAGSIQSCGKLYATASRS
jgi:hypothetical protein